MASEPRPQSPGLKWRKRKHGPDVPYWFPSEEAIAAGYPVKSANLNELAPDPVNLVKRAERLQSEMLRWLSGKRTSRPVFDGSFKSMFLVYQTDPQSTFFTNCNANTRETYTVYLKKLIAHVGMIRIDHTDGRDVGRWFEIWRESGLAAAKMAFAVMKAAISFGVICRFKGCVEFKEVLDEMAFESLKSRTQAPTAAEIIAVRAAAHMNGAPLRALCYAIQFETTLRQWDVTGQWIPLSDPRPSLVLFGKKKWIGPQWAQIEDLRLKIKPTKTQDTTGVEVSFDLASCPMVIEELALLGEAPRSGPLIVNHRTGRPYTHPVFRQGWRADATRAGLPVTLQDRDLRAGGITEGGRAGAAKDDRRKLAAHAQERTTEIYDRDQLEAHRRVMQARKSFREKNGG